MNFNSMTTRVPVPVLSMAPVPVLWTALLTFTANNFCCAISFTDIKNFFHSSDIYHHLHPTARGEREAGPGVVPARDQRNLTLINLCSASERDPLTVVIGARGPVPVPVPVLFIFYLYATSLIGSNNFNFSFNINYCLHPIASVVLVAEPEVGPALARRILNIINPFDARERDPVPMANGAWRPVPVPVPASISSRTLLILAIITPRIRVGMEGDLIDLREPGDCLPGARYADPATAPPTQMETDSSSAPNLGNVFKQCKLAKETGISIQNTVFGSGSECNFAPAKPARIGNIDMPGDSEVLNTFHGARICKGRKTVNDCISLSFDPRNFMCLGCKTSHRIGDRGPITVCFSDQNFIPFLMDKEGGCIAVVRLDNATLSELVELSFEIFENFPLPPGSVVLFGSASFLFRAGVSVYAREWVDSTTKVGAKWRNVHICPLIPFIRENCPGSMARDIEQLSAWLIRIYTDNTAGLRECWESLLMHTREHTQEGCLLSQGEHHKLPLPTSLSTSSLSPHCYSFARSCPILLNGLSQRATEDLARVLTRCLRSNFSTAINPDFLIQRELKAADTSAFCNHVTVLGASNARNLCSHLESLGFSITNLAIPGWVASEKNVSDLIEKIKNANIPPGSGILLDLFSNSTYRYEQFDGTLALPFKEGGKYHMAGDITVCSDSNFKRIVGALAPILLAAQSSLKVILPPMPRYIDGGCCGNPTHSTNVGGADYGNRLLEKVVGLRGLLKSELGRLGVKNFWLLDGVATLLGIDPKVNRDSNKTLLPEIAGKISPDRVHFTSAGYQNMAKVIQNTFHGLAAGSLKNPDRNTSCTVSGRDSSRHTYFWRGFVSPVGIPMPTDTGYGSGYGSQRHGKVHQRHHPYARRGNN
jgi:hypothetical protein